MNWLPPEQIATRKFPVVGERAPTPEALDLEAWRLSVGGHVERPMVLDWPSLLARPQESFTLDVHCVTRWSHQAMRFGGTRLAPLLDEASPLPQATHVRFVAYSARGHDSCLPLELARDAWLVHEYGGEPLSVEHGYPLRVVTPGRYFYKSLKWVRAIELRDEDTLGYWERTDGYHPNADPWPGDQRYVSGSLPPDVLAQLLGATDFTRWRKRTIRSADLREWCPRGRSLGALKLKNCDLRGADLRGCDLQDANFSLSDLRGADLREAKLRGADLEGARLAGADLRGADLRDAALTATTFFEAGSAARVEGARFEGAFGLLERQAQLLEDALQ